MITGTETVERYCEYMARNYCDFSHIHDRLIRFCAGVIASEIRRNGSNNFQAVITLIEDQGWETIEKCLRERYGHARAMKYLQKDDTSFQNNSFMITAFTLAWDKSPLYEERMREYAKQIQLTDLAA